MRLLFLGTGAPEGNPSPFCDCPNCQYARKKRRRNIRLQASLLVNNDLLIDFGSDVTRGFNANGISMSKLHYVLVTHCHADHFFAWNFYNRLEGPRTTPVSDLHVYGPSRIKRLSASWLKREDQQKVTLHTIEPFQKLRIAKYRVQTFMITQSGQFAGKGMCFAISEGTKTLLYAVDTYFFPEKNWKAMSGLVFDTVILDETFGFKDPPNKDHHNIPMFFKTIARMKANGMFHERTKCYSQHMSHHNPPHDKLTKIMAKHNVIVPYDGLRVTC